MFLTFIIANNWYEYSIMEMVFFFIWAIFKDREIEVRSTYEPGIKNENVSIAYTIVNLI